MANMQKYSSMKDIGHLCAHYERSVDEGHYSNPDIDQNRLDEDRQNLAPDRGKQTDYIKNTIAEIMDGRTVRKDAVRMCCWIVDAPETLPANKRQVFFQESYNFMVDRYGRKSGMGENVVVSSYIHRSETTEHVHFAFVPVVERDGIKTLCAKECVGRDDLKTFHEDLARHMESRGICRREDILNGATKRDSSGRAYSVKELKRIDYRNRIQERDRTADTGNRWAREYKQRDYDMRGGWR